MTIKQQGGVFGRNPVFNDAEAKDLTVTNSMNVDNGTLQVDPVNNRVGVKIAPTADLHVYNPSALAMLRVEAGANSAYLNLKNSTRSWNIYSDSATGKLSFFDVTFGVERMALSTSGNLSFASGKGIDFSATSGTGTSELFDDYEEGTWTPAYNTTNSNLTVNHDVQVGYYVKVGSLVTCTGRLRTDSVSGGTGQVQIHGLPFAAKDVSVEGSVGSLTTTLATSFVNAPNNGYLREGTTFAELRKNGGVDPVAVADLGTGGNENALYFSLTYLTD